MNNVLHSDKKNRSGEAQQPHAQELYHAYILISHSDF